ncbi:putative exported protein [Halobacteriovorax marinus SJ]|uniref:Exported protein n=1 Tax=Halobacteriovorax marinus (strain ATCC BAA-682 / DSM 15412 / SJ) TaxID=862908 RepID=E1WY58_HALMS|nr:hypothetical protein [Halobacteriovorax marinus]CBW27613.1 putative exported protein [Halobacteriovorax marinus SJ]
MKRILFLLIIGAIYAGSLIWKGEQVKIAKNKDVPTLYRYWQESGTPVYTEKAVERSLSDTIAVTGLRTTGRRVKSLVAPRIASKLSVGAIARITKDNTIYNGKVTFISNQVDELSGLFEIVITFSKNVVTSKSVVVQVEIGHLDRSVVVKREAVSTRGGKPHLYIVKNNQISKKFVSLGGNNDDYYAISSGVKVGDEIVISDQRYLKDQQKVLVVKRVE